MKSNFEHRAISRRSFLKGAGIVGAASVLAACGSSSSSTAASQATSTASSAAAGDAAAAASDPAVTLVYAEVNPLDTIVGQTATAFKEKVEETTSWTTSWPAATPSTCPVSRLSR